MASYSTKSAALLRLIAEHAAQVEEVMQADLAAALADSDPLLHEVVEYALLGGGKRLRSFLSTICARLCGGGEEGQLRLLSAAFEYLHTATLIHDDVIDHAASRRGKASMVRRYGMTAAILAGDWLHARSMRLVGLAGAQALEVFCTATADMVDGEFLQMCHARNLAVTEEQYLSVIKKKTAGLIKAACAVGALHGQGSPEQVAALAMYGEKIGLAFQIADDLLDYLGEEEQTGKATGNDFAEGKMTLPLIHALRHAAPQDRELLCSSLADNQQSGTFTAVRSILAQSGSFAYCRVRAEEEMEKGLAALSCFTQAEQQEDVAALRSLADYVLNRER